MSGKSTLEELREMNVSKQKAARAAAAAPDASNQLYIDSPTQLLTQVSKEISKSLSNDASKEVLPLVAPDGLMGLRSSANEVGTQGGGSIGEEHREAGGEASAPAVPAARDGGARQEVARPRPPRRDPRASGGVGYASVRDRLQAGTGKEALTRLSVDVTESMHARIKEYCAVNRVPSSRLLIITLVDEFLTSEGF